MYNMNKRVIKYFERKIIVSNVKLIVDRFEGEYAVCENEDGTMVDIRRDKLPKETKEGDVLIVEGDTFVIDVQATLERKEYIKKLMDDLWQ